MGEHNVVRTDSLSGTSDGSKLRSFKFYDGATPAAIDNGMVVKLDGLLSGEREVYKAVKPAASTPINEVALVASPEYMVEEHKHSLTDFTNDASEVSRGYKLVSGDRFGVTEKCFDTKPVVGNIVELMEGTTFKAVATATSGSTTIGKVIAIEGESGITYYVIEVA